MKRTSVIMPFLGALQLTERGALRGALAHQLKFGGGLAALQRLVALDYPQRHNPLQPGTLVDAAAVEAMKLPPHYLPLNNVSQDSSVNI